MRSTWFVQRLSFEWEFAVLVTNQVVDAVKDGSSLDTNSTKVGKLIAWFDYTRTVAD